MKQGRAITAIAPWFGSKRTDRQRIARECCNADGSAPKAFWDLCCGSLAVSLAMPRCAHHYAVDLHADLCNLARIIKDPALGPKFYRHLRRILHHETVFKEYRQKVEFGDTLFGGQEMQPFERALAYFIVSWQGRNGVAGTKRLNYQMAKRWTSGGGHGAIRYANAVRSIPQWRRRLRDITIIEDDIFVVLEKIEDQGGTVIYLDPPYLRDGERTGACVYLHEFTMKQHADLCALLRRRFKQTRVVISYYDHPWLRESYEGWEVVDLKRQKNLHVQNRRGVGQLEAPEILLINGNSYTADWSDADEDEAIEEVAETVEVA